MKNKIIECLNNECGGPNLENMIGIGLSIAAFTALSQLRNSIYNYIARAMSCAVHIWNV